MSGFRFRLAAASVAVTGGLLSAMIEGSWTIGGAVAAIVAAAVVIISAVYEFIIGPRWRRRTLRRPCKAWFLIASTNQRTISHAVQDSREHYVEELTLASNSEYEIEFLYVPSITFVVSEIYFGFNKQDDRDLDTKPIIKSFCNHFIERGTHEESPETHPETNYADHHKFYHIRKPRNIARREPYSIGCKIQTRQAGKYEFNLVFAGEEVGQPKNKLFVRVEDNPTTRMKCIFPKHRKCFVQPAGKALPIAR
jgi:hypothetical protein